MTQRRLEINDSRKIFLGLLRALREEADVQRRCDAIHHLGEYAREDLGLVPQVLMALREVDARLADDLLQPDILYARKLLEEFDEEAGLVAERAALHLSIRRSNIAIVASGVGGFVITVILGVVNLGDGVGVMVFLLLVTLCVFGGAVLRRHNCLGLLADSESGDSDPRLTEEYAHAIDQLGSERPEIRIGGIHSLERIAYYCPEYRPSAIGTLQGYLDTKQEELSRSELKSRPPPDVEAAQAVLGRMISW